MTPLPQFEIISASAGGLSAVMTVMREAFDPVFGEAWTLPQCESILAMPGSWLIIAMNDGDPAGFALIRSAIFEAELLLIAVRSRFRRRGIGQQLLARVVSDCCSAKIECVHLEVRADNVATAFYEQQGFVRVGIRKNYYRGASGQFTDAITLTKTLVG